jgi:hypothetical protein
MWSTRTSRIGFLVLTLLLLTLSGCELAAEPMPPPTSEVEQLTGGILATFDVDAERFRIWVTNPDAVEQILDLYFDESTSATIPRGRVLRGPGLAGHNAPWRWHLDPEEIEMVPFAREECDALPSQVEANLLHFVEGVERYCPWAAELVDVQDLR